MANAFSPGRLGLWHTSPLSFNLDYGKVRGWGFTDIFRPSDKTTVTQMNADRAQMSADGSKFRAQLYVDGTHGQTGTQLAEHTLDRIAALKTGVVEVDFEGPDDNKIGVTVREFLTAFRQGVDWRFRFPLCVNVVSFKGYVLPFDLMTPDPYCYGRIQPFYGGEMRPADPLEALEDWLDRGFPRDRLSFIYSAKPRRQIDSSIFEDLPVFSDGGVYVRKLRRGAVFNANLLREAGLI